MLRERVTWAEHQEASERLRSVSPGDSAASDLEAQAKAAHAAYWDAWDRASALLDALGKATQDVYWREHRSIDPELLAEGARVREEFAV